MEKIRRLLLRVGDLIYSIVSRLEMAAYERYLEEKLRAGPIPQHVAVILDGNRRFARRAGIPLIEAYRMGARRAREIADWCDSLGVKHVTFFVLSTENFSRPKRELEAVLSVIRENLRGFLNELDTLKEKGVRVRFAGRLWMLPKDIREIAKEIEEKTARFGERSVNIAIAYGGRAEIVDAVRKIAEEVRKGRLDPEDINEDVIKGHLYLGDLPDPDLIIRTSGEERISNFLLWQSAYSELCFLDVYLPAMRKVDFLRAVREYQRRSRRFGR